MSVKNLLEPDHSKALEIFDAEICVAKEAGGGDAELGELVTHMCRVQRS